MAEVTGELGGQPLILNNAATESTLQQLLVAMTAMAKASGKDAKSQRELEKELRKLADASKKFKKEQEALSAATKKQREEEEKAAKVAKQLADAKAKEKKAVEDLVSGLNGLSNAVEKTALGVTGLVGTFSNLGNSVSSAAQAMSAIPVVGGTVAAVFGAVAGAAERSYKAFQQSASVGANFGGSITDMINSASSAGLTIDQFSALIAKNGENLALLGGNTSAGAKRLAELSKTIRQSSIGDDLARLGYSTEDISDGMARFSGRLAKTGALQTMTTEQIAKVSGEYLKNLDAVSRLTGKSKEALQAEEEARMRDAQYLALKNKLDVESQKNLEILMSSIPAEMQAGAKEVLATGTATSDAGREFLAFMNRSGQDLAGLGMSMRQTGRLSLDSASNMADRMQAEGKALAASSLGDTLSSFGTDAQKSLMLSAYTYQGQQQTGLDQGILTVSPQ